MPKAVWTSMTPHNNARMAAYKELAEAFALLARNWEHIPGSIYPRILSDAGEWLQSYDWLQDPELCRMLIPIMLQKMAEED